MAGRVRAVVKRILDSCAWIIFREVEVKSASTGQAAVTGIDGFSDKVILED